MRRCGSVYHRQQYAIVGAKSSSLPCHGELSTFEDVLDSDSGRFWDVNLSYVRQRILFGAHKRYFCRNRRVAGRA